MFRKAAVSFLFALGSVNALACHSPEPASPTAGLTQPVDPPKTPDLGHGADRVEERSLYSLYIVDSIRTLCSGPDPFFHFDSSKPDTMDQPTMMNLVTCMTSGPLRGKGIVLVGRTDPREKLGLERAERVKRYLVTKGIDDARIRTASLGKDDASPAPADWPSDRRVEVRAATP
jgi:peptidoglycan-associated lipoprotein